MNAPQPSKRAERWFVPDLVPRGVEVRAVFVGESPHKDEIKPERMDERSPFRGSAGRDWWVALFERAGQPLVPKPHRRTPDVPPRKELEDVCRSLHIAVLNAVRFPLDPRITQHYPEFVPMECLGFDKGSADRKGKGNGKGAFGYKTVFENHDRAGPVGETIDDLARRLKRFSNTSARVVCLGNDSLWFVERAIQRLPQACALAGLTPAKIPHPTSWKFSRPQEGQNFRAEAARVLKAVLG